MTSAALPAATLTRVGSAAPALTWVTVLVACVLFTPNLVLPGGIPFRADDALVLGGLALVVARDVVIARRPRLHALEVVLAVSALYYVVDALLGSPAGGSVGAKEYLDLLRPLKFLGVLHLTRRMADPEAAVRGFARALAVSTVALGALGLAQILLLEPSSNGILARFSLLYMAVEQQTRNYFGFRAMGTFGTPTDLAYVCTVALFGAMAARGFPWRPLVAGIAAVTVVITGTRTFLFAGPAILIAVTALAGGSLMSRVRNAALAALVVVIAWWAATSLMSVGATEGILTTVRTLRGGDIEADDSVRLRLLNLVLAEQTWAVAPWRGVVTRDFMRPELVGGVDSEYLMIFHRYGLIGLGLLLAVWWSLWRIARRVGQSQPSLSLWLMMIVGIGVLYGVTQGAYINTRIGVFPFLVAGLALGVEERRSERPARPSPVRETGT